MACDAAEADALLGRAEDVLPGEVAGGAEDDMPAFLITGAARWPAIEEDVRICELLMVLEVLVTFIV